MQNLGWGNDPILSDLKSNHLENPSDEPFIRMQEVRAGQTSPVTIASALPWADQKMKLRREVKKSCLAIRDDRGDA